MSILVTVSPPSVPAAAPGSAFVAAFFVSAEFFSALAISVVVELKSAAVLAAMILCSEADLLKKREKLVF